MFNNSWAIASLLNLSLLTVAWLLPKKLLTPMGYIHAWILGVLVWGTLHWQGYIVVMFYFLVGSALTKVGMEQKEAEGIAEKRSGMRGPENVWGSALAATLCAVATLFVDSPVKELLILGYVASFATKLSDTTASEIGKAYGKTTFLITNFNPVPRGTEGAVSLEGTIAGILGSVAIAFIGYVVGLINFSGIIICIIAAFIATNIESVIGATVQSRFSWLTNEIVNFINTAIGAMTAIFINILIL